MTITARRAGSKDVAPGVLASPPRAPGRGRDPHAWDTTRVSGLLMAHQAIRLPMSGLCRKTARPDQVVHADRHGDRYEADRCDHRVTEGVGIGSDAVSGERVEEDGTDEG